MSASLRGIHWFFPLKEAHLYACLLPVAISLRKSWDRQAADAVRGRIDLKYALSLELTDPGFDFTILSDFRKRLV
jgi:transposase